MDGVCVFTECDFLHRVDLVVPVFVSVLFYISSIINIILNEMTIIQEVFNTSLILVDLPLIYSLLICSHVLSIHCTQSFSLKTRISIYY